MNHLSGMDASYLHFETPEMPMHAGSLQIVDLPEGYAGDYCEDVKRCVAGRMHLADVFQRKLALMPFEQPNPVWLDDEDLDIEHRVRHAAIDGQAGVALTKALLGGSAVPAPIGRPRPWLRMNQYQRGTVERAGAALSNAVHRATTNQRAFAARSLPLADIKLMAKRGGASSNDIVLAICPGAPKRHRADDSFTPDGLRAACVPVSFGEAGNADPNNLVAMMMVSLATDVKDPLDRLHAIKASANAGKKLTGSCKRAMPTGLPALGVPWLMSGAASLYGRSRLAERPPPIVNAAISNLPGPQHPLYCAGAKLAGFFSVSIPAHGIALNMAVPSYDDALEVGPTACRRAMPDLTDLADPGVHEFELLRGLIEAPELAAPTVVAMAAAALPAVKAVVPAARIRARRRVAATKPAAAPPLPSPPISAAGCTRRVSAASHAT